MSEVKVVPELEDKDITLDWVPTKDQEKRGKRIHKRIDTMLDHRHPYESQMKRSILFYEGELDQGDRKDALRKSQNAVAPFARIFVETKTAEEVKVFSEYKIVPVEDAGDSWKVELLGEVNKHVKRNIKLQAKRHQLMRMKNIAGVSIARVGYRRIMGVRKVRTQTNEHGDILGWKEIPVPIEDDIFLDVVSPLNFAVDPNAASMDDAMDCGHFHAENFESFWEYYGNDDRFQDVDSVSPGRHGKITTRGFTEGNFRSQHAKENMVVIAEYFNRIRDEWVVYANGVEIYYGALPDDHKELPFVSYHNSPTFMTPTGQTSVLTSTGEEVGQESSVLAEETFWTVGDPHILEDLIVLRTEHGRSAHRAHKLAGQSIIATLGNFQFDESRPWRSGDQAKGAMNKFQVVPMGRGDSGNWQFVFDDLVQQMILAAGIDPRNLTESKTKTATEASIQRETSMRRLEQNIEYNEEHAEVRLGKLIHQLIQQRYTKPEIVRLLGDESAEDMKRFDEVEEDDETGVPVFGKRFRRIPTETPLVVKGTGMNEDDAGLKSFIAKPEYIRTSNVDISVTTKRRAGEVQSIEFEKAARALEIFVQIFPMAQPDPNTGKAIVDLEDLPNLRSLVEKMIKAIGLSPEKDIGQTPDKKSKDEEEAEEALRLMESSPPMNVPVG